MVERFTTQLDGLINRTRARLEEAAKESALQIGRTVVQRTPVQTGFLAGSWFVSINNGAASFQGSEDTTGANSKARIASGLEAYELGDTIYILNTTSYGEFVEFGTVKMAPRSFVRSTVGDAPQIVNATVRSFNLR